jgi:[ribosomal protein S5]-alanine N-acetyltransferase
MDGSRRLRLRRYGPGDLERLRRLLTDPATMAHWPAPLTTEQARAWLERALAAYTMPGYGRFAIELNDGTYVGDAGILRAEIDGVVENDLGYIIDHRYWRRGYGLEAARLCVACGRSRGLRRIVANMAADNVGSVRVAELLGFQLQRRFVNPRNRNKETLLYASEATAQSSRP